MNQKHFLILLLESRLRCSGLRKQMPLEPLLEESPTPCIDHPDHLCHPPPSPYSPCSPHSALMHLLAPMAQLGPLHGRGDCLNTSLCAPLLPNSMRPLSLHLPSSNCCYHTLTTSPFCYRFSLARTRSSPSILLPTINRFHDTNHARASYDPYAATARRAACPKGLFQ